MESTVGVIAGPRAPRICARGATLGTGSDGHGARLGRRPSAQGAPKWISSNRAPTRTTPSPSSWLCVWRVLLSRFGGNATRITASARAFLRLAAGSATPARLANNPRARAVRPLRRGRRRSLRDRRPRQARTGAHPKTYWTSRGRASQTNWRVGIWPIRASMG